VMSVGFVDHVQALRRERPVQFVGNCISNAHWPAFSDPAAAASNEQPNATKQCGASKKSAFVNLAGTPQNSA
jgi:hypothetical protein